MRKTGWLLLSLVFWSLRLLAQSPCAAPAPAALTIVEEGNDYISIAWTPVAGASSYLVTTTLFPSGELVNTTVTGATEFIESDLEPGETYEFSVQASYCWGGPFGNPIFAKGRTTIIIHDIVLELNCTNPTYNSNHDPGTPLEVGLQNPGDALKVGITVLNTGSHIDLQLRRNGSDQLVVALYPEQEGFGLYGPNAQGHVEGAYSNKRDLDRVFTLQSVLRKLQNNSLFAVFIWDTEVQVSYQRCSVPNAAGSGLRGAAGVPPRASAEGMVHRASMSSVSLYPNPVRGLLNLHCSAPGGQLEIVDINGRLWASRVLEVSDQSITLPAGEWPPGFYFLRWRDQNGFLTTIPFVKVE
ncbi:MAG: fibronectin type III domain-containing protein [Lewinella sp.]|nr:fibronectin type III domain-containing protein [Lewinella sp.]